MAAGFHGEIAIVRCRATVSIACSSWAARSRTARGAERPQRWRRRPSFRSTSHWPLATIRKNVGREQRVPGPPARGRSRSGCRGSSKRHFRGTTGGLVLAGFPTPAQSSPQGHSLLRPGPSITWPRCGSTGSTSAGTRAAKGHSCSTDRRDLKPKEQEPPGGPRPQSEE